LKPIISATKAKSENYDSMTDEELVAAFERTLKLRGMKQAEFAGRIGFHPSYISKWKSGACPAKIIRVGVIEFLSSFQ